MEYPTGVLGSITVEAWAKVPRRWWQFWKEGFTTIEQLQAEMERLGNEVIEIDRKKRRIKVHYSKVEV